MTQSAVHGPDGSMEDGQGQPGPEPERGRGSTPWRKSAAITAAGVPVGILWWLLAPSGLNLLSGNAALRNGSNMETWLPRDLVLAGLFLLAGSIAGALVSGTKDQGPPSRDVALAVLAGALGAVIAWRTGVLCGVWWGPAADASASASTAFSLRSYAMLAIWPAAVALSVFLGGVFTTPPKPASGDPAA
ncbi:hypothetical protein [Arthrobacter sp. UYEF20]|uniref:hypothetical protein n=1 Tax=Arthrobacter sp. UYEF20 TaxID=1756363 RepID=UPI0033970501